MQINTEWTLRLEDLGREMEGRGVWEERSSILIALVNVHSSVSTIFEKFVRVERVLRRLFLISRSTGKGGEIQRGWVPWGVLVALVEGRYKRVVEKDLSGEGTVGVGNGGVADISHLLHGKFVQTNLAMSDVGGPQLLRGVTHFSQQLRISGVYEIGRTSGNSIILKSEERY